MYPSKVTSFNESIFPKYIVLARLIQTNSWKLHNLWCECSLVFIDLNEFIQALTDLYALGLIDFEARKVHWIAETN